MATQGSQAAQTQEEAQQGKATTQEEEEEGAYRAHQLRRELGRQQLGRRRQFFQEHDARTFCIEDVSMITHYSQYHTRFKIAVVNHKTTRANKRLKGRNAHPVRTQSASRLHRLFQ
jgi:hypothetical protein